ncbi:hypothetical protein HBB16_10150 [Pseudonocardia sp. MCCB 268]|nr:hypothetical protein [Pseudonocardia cytotoxica]
MIRQPCGRGSATTSRRASPGPPGQTGGAGVHHFRPLRPRQSPASYVGGRVALIGDAAHPMTPTSVAVRAGARRRRHHNRELTIHAHVEGRARHLRRSPPPPHPATRARRPADEPRGAHPPSARTGTEHWPYGCSTVGRHHSDRLGGASIGLPRGPSRSCARTRRPDQC